MYARGMTMREIQGFLPEPYGLYGRHGTVTGKGEVNLAGSSFPSGVATSGGGHVQPPIVWRNERLEIVERFTAGERRAFQQHAARA